MGLFDFFKNKKKVVWRDANNHIVCQGDHCPMKECDYTCPIWCQSIAISLMEMKEYEKAIHLLQKALIIAPDFKDVWVNLGAIYGNMNNHMEANKAFKSAYTIDKNYKNAISGLIISCMHLGQFEEAMHYCDEYASKVDRRKAEDFREQVRQAKGAGKISRHESALDMALKIVDHAREQGLLPPNDHFQNIPEIMVAGKITCMKIFQDLTKHKEARKPEIWLQWAAYAGMGAVYHWDLDWNSLKQKGIAETLLEPRGSYAMDEYVIDSIGIGFNTLEGTALTNEITALSLWCLKKFEMRITCEEDVKAIVQEGMQAMYLFGMVYEMERLGMR